MEKKDKPFYLRLSFWLKIILISGACYAPFIPEKVKNIITMFLIGV